MNGAIASPAEIDRVIAQARAMLGDRSLYTGHALARDAAGRPCCPTADDAMTFCAVGALIRAAFDVTGDRATALQLAEAAADRVAADYARPGLGMRLLAEVNDEHGRDVALMLLERCRASVPPARQKRWPGFEAAPAPAPATVAD